MPGYYNHAIPQRMWDEFHFQLESEPNKEISPIKTCKKILLVTPDLFGGDQGTCIKWQKNPAVENEQIEVLTSIEPAKKSSSGHSARLKRKGRIFFLRVFCILFFDKKV